MVVIDKTNKQDAPSPQRQGQLAYCIPSCEAGKKTYLWRTNGQEAQVSHYSLNLKTVVIGKAGIGEMVYGNSAEGASSWKQCCHLGNCSAGGSIAPLHWHRAHSRQNALLVSGIWEWV